MSTHEQFVVEVEAEESTKHKHTSESDYSVICYGRSFVELMFQNGLFVLINGSELTIFKLILASVLGLFKAAHAQVGVSNNTGD